VGDLFSDYELERREVIRDGIFRSAGITFTVYGDDDGIERTFPMDLLPRLIPADEWEVIERGVIQRVTALNRLLEDLYAGEQAAVHDGVVPRWLVHTAEGFRREAFGIAVPHAARCMVSGVDLVRDHEGTYCVLEDNLRNPSGISYVLENRAAMARVLPVAFAAQRIRPVDHDGPMLLRAMRSIASPSAGENPLAVVLTPGVYNSAYFEHAFLARQMGIQLVEGRDLVVDEHVVYAFVPDTIRFYLGEEPILANVTTYLLWDDDQRAAVLDRLGELVVKPVAESGGYGMRIGPHATDEEVEVFRGLIARNPRGYIAQEIVSLSRHPRLIGDRMEGRHIDLRPFAISGENVEVIPGGLTRVALKRGSLVVNSSQGGGSKDTWVLEADAAP
jgi:uncharacterized circularly permuted ATP-grasp superfamily protein